MSTEYDDSSTQSDKQFMFTIENGVVTAFFEVENGVSEQQSIDNEDSFFIEGDQITHTKQTADGSEVTIYSDSDGDGLYTISSDSDDTDDNDDSDDDSINDEDDHPPESGEHKTFQFTISDDQITEVFEIKDGVPEPKSVDDNSETYAVDGTEVVHTEIETLGIEVTRYADIDGDGSYHRISEQWIPDTPGSGPFNIEDELKFSPTDDDDLIAVRGGEDCHGGSGADQFVFREAAHLRIGDFNSSEGDLLVFDTGLGLTSVDHLASFVTDIRRSDDDQDLIVDFGPDVSITFVGIQPDQISWDDVSVLS
ncbi:hypothetical protein [Nitrosomonas sp. Nm166]|uniref:hypothetical protein n=1 Tax=Nitrosomonas sp. Nm166 TaxID=1881054 RepID=UPI0008E88A83|nr:hypothetical protein [Nitrosomonas sp. Nm166]SFE69788.1 hypothetical protein SAMN05428977_102615 [Nitrosomonas sp. Nm166]